MPYRFLSLLLGLLNSQITFNPTKHFPRNWFFMKTGNKIMPWQQSKGLGKGPREEVFEHRTHCLSSLQNTFVKRKICFEYNKFYSTQMSWHEGGKSQNICWMQHTSCNTSSTEFFPDNVRLTITKCNFEAFLLQWCKKGTWPLCVFYSAQSVLHTLCSLKNQIKLLRLFCSCNWDWQIAAYKFMAKFAL